MKAIVTNKLKEDIARLLEEYTKETGLIIEEIDLISQINTDNSLDYFLNLRIVCP